jgi:hypothetical protein
MDGKFRGASLQGNRGCAIQSWVSARFSSPTDPLGFGNCRHSTSPDARTAWLGREEFARRPVKFSERAIPLPEKAVKSWQNGVQTSERILAGFAHGDSPPAPCSRRESPVLSGEAYCERSLCQACSNSRTVLFIAVLKADSKL